MTFETHPPYQEENPAASVCFYWTNSNDPSETDVGTWSRQVYLRLIFIHIYIALIDGKSKWLRELFLGTPNETGIIFVIYIYFF